MTPGLQIKGAKTRWLWRRHPRVMRQQFERDVATVSAIRGRFNAQPDRTEMAIQRWESGEWVDAVAENRQ